MTAACESRKGHIGVNFKQLLETDLHDQNSSNAVLGVTDIKYSRGSCPWMMVWIDDTHISPFCYDICGTAAEDAVIDTEVMTACAQKKAVTDPGLVSIA